MKLNIIKILIISCCLSVLSCTKETKETIVIQNNDITNQKNPDELSVEQDSFISSLPNINILEENILIPNGGGKTLKDFESELQSGIWDNWINKNWLGKKGGMSQTPENFKYFFWGMMTKSAVKFTSDTYFTFAFEDGKKPEQKRLAYRYGGNKDYWGRIIPEYSRGVYSSFSPIYGIDCSGLVYHILKESGTIGYPIMTASDQISKPKLIEKAIVKGFPFMKDNITVTQNNNPTENDIDYGDIVYFKDNHIGLAIKDYQNNKIIAQSNGLPARTQKIYDDNLKKGPHWKNLTNMLKWGFTGIESIRINIKLPCNAKTISGGNGVTENIHALGLNNGKVFIDYDMFPIPDKIDVYYRDVLVKSSGVKSNKGQIEYDYVVIGNTDFIKVVVTGTDPNTAWEYTVNCPQ